MFDVGISSSFFQSLFKLFNTFFKASNFLSLFNNFV